MRRARRIPGVLPRPRGRAAALAVWLAVLSGPARAGDAPYLWSISASSTDPFRNTAVATGEEEFAWVWLVSVEPPLGLSAAQFGLETDGPEILSTVAWNNFLNAGSDTCLLLANEPPRPGASVTARNCSTGPVAALRVTYVSHAGTLCIGTCYGVAGSVDCNPLPELWPIDWIGLGVGSEACEPPVSVHATSWGRLKTRYR